MNSVLLVLAAFLLGFIAAIPVGPVQIETVRMSISGNLKTSLMTVLGAFCADVFYGIIAFFGIAPFLAEKKVVAIFWLIGGLLLVVFGILAIRHSSKSGGGKNSARYLKKKRWAFLGGISLSGINPMMILWWLSGIRLFQDIGLIREFTYETAVLFLAAGSLGLATYLTALSLFLYWAKRFIPEKTIRRINLAFGVMLFMISLYFISTSLRTLLTLS